MKKFHNAFIILAILAASVVVIIGGHYLSGKYLTNDNSKAKPSPVVSCAKKGKAHFVSIHNGQMIPRQTQASLCDTLTITNKDNRIRLIAFGPHEHHTPYDGVTEKALSQGKSLTVTLNQAGVYTFHDHLEDSVTGTFTVSK